MKLSFFPGDLHLSDSATGYVLMKQGIEVFRTHSERAAIGRFNRVRAEMEKNGAGPKTVPPAAVQPAVVLQVVPSDLAVRSNGRPAQKKKRMRKVVTPSSAPVHVVRFKAAPKAKRQAPAGNDVVASHKLQRSDVQQTLRELRAQRDSICRAIAALEGLDGA